MKHTSVLISIIIIIIIMHSYLPLQNNCQISGVVSALFPLILNVSLLLELPRVLT